MGEGREPESRVAGVVAQFGSAEALVAAAERVRQAGFRRWDAHSPFPVHGLERAMGIRMTLLPWLVLVAGIAGGAAALVLQWWTNGVDYPHNISGKPLFSLPAHIPVTFELIVLASALTAFFGALALSRLPQYGHRAFSVERFRRVTTDGFYLSIDAEDERFEDGATGSFLESIGAISVETCRDPAAAARVPAGWTWAAAVVAVVALLPPLLVAWARATPSRSPRFHPLRDMDFQPKYKAQTASPLFADGRSNRPQVPGAVARGRLEDDDHFYRGQVDGTWAEAFPDRLPLTMRTMVRGRERFDVYCAPCHGLAGDGDGPVARRAQELAAGGQAADWVPPTQLAAPPLRAQPVGQLFSTITHGVRTMPAYGGQISAKDRWAMVLYVRALQRSQTADREDIPEQERARAGL